MSARRGSPRAQRPTTGYEAHLPGVAARPAVARARWDVSGVRFHDRGLVRLMRHNAAICPQV